MGYDPEKHHRRSIRLRGWDYSRPGAYFVTICTHNGECLLGWVVDGKMMLSPWGQIARDEWMASAKIRHEIRLDAFVVMPDHIHGIIWIVAGNNVGATGRSPLRPHGPSPKSLGSFIAGYKSAVTKRINEMRKTPGTPVWQRNYYEHIIRDEEESNATRLYIIENPQNWDIDTENPDFRQL